MPQIRAHSTRPAAIFSPSSNRATKRSPLVQSPQALLPRHFASPAKTAESVTYVLGIELLPFSQEGHAGEEEFHGRGSCRTNVNRSYSLAATSLAIFTFMLFFLYPKFASGEINALLFQAALVVMGVATFSFVFSSFYYYCSSLGDRFNDADRATYSRRADRFWLAGYTLLFLAPSLVLFAIGLLAVGSVWFALWLVNVLFVIRHFPRIQTARKNSWSVKTEFRRSRKP